MKEKFVLRYDMESGQCIGTMPLNAFELVVEITDLLRERVDGDRVLSFEVARVNEGTRWKP